MIHTSLSFSLCYYAFQINTHIKNFIFNTNHSVPTCQAPVALPASQWMLPRNLALGFSHAISRFLGGGNKNTWNKGSVEGSDPVQVAQSEGGSDSTASQGSLASCPERGEAVLGGSLPLRSTQTPGPWSAAWEDKADSLLWLEKGLRQRQVPARPGGRVRHPGTLW